jgi:magnesium transporter
MSYRRISKKIELLTINNPVTNNKIEWYNIVSAGKSELEYIRRRYGFNMEHIQAATATSFSQRPMVMEETKYVFLILHFPTFNGKRIKAAEVDFFIGHGFIITLHNDNLPALTNFFNLCKKDAISLESYKKSSSAILLAEILDPLIKSCYLILDRNTTEIDQVESVIFSNEQKKAVGIILNLRHNIINIRKIFQNHKNILQKLMGLRSSIVPSVEIKKHYIELVEHSKRIWESLDNQKETIEALNSTNSSLLNDRMTDIMKTLTIISVIVFPLTLLAAIFTMRTKYMPLVDDPNSFWILLGLMLVVSLGMLTWFKSKKWL